MKDKKKLIIVIVLLLVAGAGYKFVFAKKGSAGPKPVPKIKGHLVQLAPEFIVNLQGDRFGKVAVALVMEELPAAGHGTGAVLPEQNAAVRAVITDALTGIPADEIITHDKREALAASILKSLRKKTDEKVDEVLFTDIAVE